MANRKQISKIQLFHLMSWMEKTAIDGMIYGDVPSIMHLATKTLGFNVTYHTTKSSLDELDIVASKSKASVLEAGEGVELLNRIKRVEKFLALNFPEEWSELI